MHDDEQSNRWHLEVDDIDVLTRMLSEPVVIGFSRAFAARDRLLSLTDAMHMNGGGAPEVEPESAVSSVAVERNHFSFAMLSAGLVHELLEAITQLHNAGLAARLSAEGRRRWEGLVELMRFDNARVISRVRNLLAFHVGDVSVVRRGIRQFSDEGRKLQVYTNDAGGMRDGRFGFATDAILAGMRVEDDGPPTQAGEKSMLRVRTQDFAAAMGEVVDAHFALLNVVEEVWLDALREAGANLDPLTGED